MTATAARPVAKKKPVTHIEALAAQLADARAQRKLWEDKEAALVEKLVQAHAAGVAPSKFTAAGWSFTYQEGRKTVIYPAPVLEMIKTIQAEAVADGVTTTKIGSPFWRVSPVKEAAA